MIQLSNFRPPFISTTDFKTLRPWQKIKLFEFRRLQCLWLWRLIGERNTYSQQNNSIEMLSVAKQQLHINIVRK